MRITITACIVLLLSVLTVSQFWGGGYGGYGGFGNGFLVPQPTYSYQLPSSYSYTPAGVSLKGNTYTFTPPTSTFGALTTYNVNQTSPQYLQPPPFAFGGTGWNQGFGFGGGYGGYGQGGIGGYNTMGFPGFGGQGFALGGGYGQGGYVSPQLGRGYSRGYSTYPSSYSRGYSPSSYSRGYNRGYLGRGYL